MPRPRKPASPFRYFNSSPKVIRLVVLMYVRFPGIEPKAQAILWLLTQGEARKTKRVRLFNDFLSQRLAAYGPLFAGLSVSSD